MADALIRYWLPTTRVRVVGITAHSWAVDWSEQRIHALPVPAVEVSFHASADTSSPRGAASLRMDAGSTRDRDFALTLHPDGRLAAFSSKQVEQLDAIAGNVAKFAGAAAVVGLAFINPAAAAALAVAAAGPRASDGTGGAPPADDAGEDEPEGWGELPELAAVEAAAALFHRWRESHPSQAARAASLFSSLNDIDSALTASLVDLAGGLSTSAEPLAVVVAGVPAPPPLTPTETTAAVKAWTELRAARDTLAEDLDAIEAAVQAWADRAHEATASREYRAAVLDLPLVDRLPVELPASSGVAQPWTPTLGIRLVRVDPRLSDAGQVDDSDLSTTNDVRIRLARPVTIGLYLQSSGAPDKWILDQSFDVAVVDSTSRVSAIPLNTGEKSDRTVTLTIGADGLTSQIGVVQGSQLAELTRVAAQVPAGLKEGAEAARDLIAAAGKAQESAGAIRAAGLSRRISDLDLQKKLVDAELAHATAAGTRRLNEQKALLAARAEYLTQIQDFGAALLKGPSAAAPAPASAAVATTATAPTAK